MPQENEVVRQMAAANQKKRKKSAGQKKGSLVCKEFLEGDFSPKSGGYGVAGQVDT